jgi:hypothetical protein
MKIEENIGRVRIPALAKKSNGTYTLTIMYPSLA